MGTYIIGAKTGIPNPIVGNIVSDTASGTLVWVVQGIPAASTGTAVVLGGGQASVTIDGSILSTTADGIDLADLGLGSSGHNVLTVSASGRIIAADQGIRSMGDHDAITIQGSVSARHEAVQLGASDDGLGHSVLTIAAGGALTSGTDAIVDESTANRIVVQGSITATGVGIKTLGNPATVTVGQTGTIQGTVGIQSLGSGTTINIAGTITAETIGVSIDNNSAFLNTGTITGNIALLGIGAGNDVTNAGTLLSSALFQDSATTFTNTGLIKGGVFLDNDGNRLFNSGNIANAFGDGINLGTTTLSNNNILHNTGVITGDADAIHAFGQNVRLINSGQAQGFLYGAHLETMGAVVRNTGELHGAIGLGVGVTSATPQSNQMFNHGLIEGKTTGAAFDGNSVIFNDGTISGLFAGLDVTTHASGNSRIVNAGALVGEGLTLALSLHSLATNNFQVTNTGTGVMSGSVTDTLGALSLRNLGTIDGAVLMGDGNDSYDGRGGIITGAVSGEAGSDTLIGGAKDESLDGGADADNLRGGAGDDVLTGGTGADTVNGGADDDQFIATNLDDNDLYDGGTGIDTLDASFATTSVTINLDAGQATGAQIGSDRLFSIENAIGGSGLDSLVGDTFDNGLQGGDGADTLTGDDGRDTLDGGAGNDSLIGGLGRDVLTGGADGDRFVFNGLADSTTAAAGRDLITDFTGAGGVGARDRIDLTAIDANSGLAGDQAFTFVGTAAFVSGASAGSLHYVKLASTTLIEAEVNNDGVADFAILLQGAFNMVANDFLL